MIDLELRTLERQALANPSDMQAYAAFRKAKARAGIREPFGVEIEELWKRVTGDWRPAASHNVATGIIAACKTPFGKSHPKYLGLKDRTEGLVIAEPDRVTVCCFKSWGNLPFELGPWRMGPGAWHPCLALYASKADKGPTHNAVQISRVEALKWAREMR